MQVDRVRALRGPNLWTRRTAIEAIVTCDDTERDLSQFSGFEERLRALQLVDVLRALGRTE